jgi:hypothetical protein
MGRSIATLLVILTFLASQFLPEMAPSAMAASYVSSGLILNLDPKNYNGTTWTDSSGSNYNATPSSPAPTYNSSDNSISFNGTNQYFDLGNTAFSYSGTTQFSFQVTFNPSTVPSSTSSVSLIGRQNSGVAGDWFMGMVNSKVDYYVEDYPWGIQSNTTLTAGTKYVATIVYDTSGYITPYLNGVQDGTKTYFGTMGSSTIRTLIGAYLNASSPSYFYSGKIYSVLGYSRALTSTEVLQNYNVATGQTKPAVALVVNGGVTKVNYGTPTILKLSSSQPGSVTFYQNGNKIFGCSSIPYTDTSTTANCNFKPTRHGTILLTGVITPSSSAYDPNSFSLYIFAQPRTSRP